MTRSRWFMLALLGTAELLGMCLWFSASAVSPHFRMLWALTDAQSAWLTTVVQLGFVAGTALAALLNLADLLPSRIYFASAAVLAAAANLALLSASSYAAALVLRFATGFLLAGVYPPAMKMIATWFKAGRGLAIGTIVGALTLGKALPYFLSSMRQLDFRGVIAISSGAALLGALLVMLAYEDGPNPFARRPFSLRLVPSVFSHRTTRLAIGAYLGHMWELYAMWFAVGAYFLHVFTVRGDEPRTAAAAASFMAFLTIAVGAAGSVFAGAVADRAGRARVAIAAMIISASCALTLGWIDHAPFAAVATVALIWGVSVVADSAQFSAVVTEVAPPHAVGTALTLQTSLGFALTAISISLTGRLSARYGWGVAFSTLAIGPIIGSITMRRLALALRSVDETGAN